MQKISGIVLLFILANCTSFEPVKTEAEFSRPAVQSPLWSELTTIKSGNWQAPLNSGVDALDWRLRAIDSATDSIELQTFLWSFDTVGALVLDHLVKAAERGVEVKLLIDDSFLAGEDAVFLALAEHANIEYRVFNPYRRRSSSLITRQILNLGEFHRLDHRMHNKAMVVDGQIAIVGGRNLADEYFGLQDNSNFRDMELIVGGPIVQDLVIAFDEYWNDLWSVPIASVSHVQHTEADLTVARSIREGAVHLHEEEDPSARFNAWRQLVQGAYTGNVRLLVDEPPEDNPSSSESAPVQVANELETLFNNATDEILIISAYLIPSPDLEDAIEGAVDRGVGVRILTNSIRSNNHIVAHSHYRNHIRQLLDHGAQLHEVRVDAKERQLYMLPPIDAKSLALHAKVLVLDSDKVFIGSANLDPRSLRINTEMGLLVESESLNSALREHFRPDFTLANAWQLEIGNSGDVTWVSDDEVRSMQPAGSVSQNIEDWFFSHLPIEGEL